MASVSSVLRSASLVSVGTLIGQLIAFAGSLALVRIYSPEQMGVFTTVVAIASFISPLASGRLSNAIPLPLSNLAAISIFKISFLGAGLISGFLAITFVIFTLATGGPIESTSIWWWAVPALVVSLVVYTGTNALAVRFERYLGLALRGVLYPLIMTISQILLGLVYFGSAGLILGMVLGHIITAGTIWFPIRHLVKEEQPSNTSWRQLLKEYRHFPFALGPAGAVNSLAMQIPQIGMTVIFGLAVGGQFGMMMKILAVPIVLLGQSIGFVYGGQIAKARRAGEKDVRHLYDRMSLLLGGVATAFAVLAFFLAEPVFAWLLGEEWRMAGQFAALYMLASGMQLVASPLSQTLVVSERTSQQFTIDGLRASSLALAFVLLNYFDVEAYTAVVSISVVSMLGYFALWLLNRVAAANIRPSLSYQESS